MKDVARVVQHFQRDQLPRYTSTYRCTSPNQGPEHGAWTGLKNKFLDTFHLGKSFT